MEEDKEKSKKSAKKECVIRIAVEVVIGLTVAFICFVCNSLWDAYNPFDKAAAEDSSGSIPGQSMESGPADAGTPGTDSVSSAVLPPTPTVAPAQTPAGTLTPTPAGTPTPAPAQTPARTPTPASAVPVTPTPTPVPTATPTPTSIPTPTMTPIPEPAKNPYADPVYSGNANVGGGGNIEDGTGEAQETEPERYDSFDQDVVTGTITEPW